MSASPELIYSLLKPRIVALLLTALFPVTTTIVFLTGLFVCGKLVLNVLRLLLQVWVFRGTDVRKYRSGDDSWAVVTGASSGIGREFALQLAKKGFNIVLVARSQQKLDKVEEQISQIPGVHVKTLKHTIDFSSAGEAEWAALAGVLSTLDIGILLNNAGTNHQALVPFVEDGPTLTAEIFTVNATSVARLTSHVLPGMLARRRGLILSMGSVAGGVISLPLYTTYSATKAFLVAWTEALGSELALSNSGVDIAVINAGFVAPGMPGANYKESFALPNAERFVRSALSGIGLPRGAVGRSFVWTPYWSHALEEFMARSFVFAGSARRATYRAGIQEEAKRK